MHWAAQYIGKPWTVGGRGPDSFDCFGLLTYIYKTRYGIDIPTYSDVHSRDIKRVMVLLDRAPELTEWVRIKEPVEGAAVGLSHNQMFHHVGIYMEVDGGFVLHAMDGKKVIAQSISRLKADGWRRIEFFIHKSWQK